VAGRLATHTPNSDRFAGCQAVLSKKPFFQK